MPDPTRDLKGGPFWVRCTLDCCILLVFVVYLVLVAAYDELEFSKAGAGDQAMSAGGADCGRDGADGGPRGDRKSTLITSPFEAPGLVAGGFFVRLGWVRGYTQGREW